MMWTRAIRAHFLDFSCFSKAGTKYYARYSNYLSSVFSHICWEKETDKRIIPGQEERTSSNGASKKDSFESPLFPSVNYDQGNKQLQKLSSKPRYSMSENDACQKDRKPSKLTKLFNHVKS